MSIGDWDEKKLEAFVRSRLGLPANLRAKIGRLGFQNLTFGSEDITITAAVTASSADFDHGLGQLPRSVVATSTGGGTETKLVATVDHVDASVMRLTVRYADEVARSATVTVYWIAVA